MAETTSRLKIAAPLIAMFVLFAVWSGWWWWASQLAQTKFAEARDQFADRFSLSCLSEDWSGYPYRIMFTCQDAVIGLKRSGTTVHVTKLDVLAQAYNPSHIIVRMTGPSEIHNQPGALALTAEHLPLVTGIKFKSMTFEIASSRINDLVVKQAGGTIVTAKHIDLHLRPATGRPGFDLAASARAFVAAPGHRDEFQLEQIDAQANIDKLPPGQHRDLADFVRAAATTRTIFTLDSLSAKSSGVTASASGSVSIDQAGGLTGTLKTQLRNLDKLLASLTARGVIKEKQAKAASTLLGLFKTSDGIAADLRFKAGTAYWGPIKLGRHTPLF